jgi:polyisoprenoid-binding protein YceI
MRLELTPQSRLLIDLRATGLLQAIGHDPTLSVRSEPFTIDVAEADRIDLPVDVRFPATSIEPPADLSASDRGKMRDNLLGRDVLDAARFPMLVFQGRYAGTLAEGALAGDLLVRGVPRSMHLQVALDRVRGEIIARGLWQGRLTDLGIRPFRALLGALRLEDWIRVRLEAAFAHR